MSEAHSLNIGPSEGVVAACAAVSKDERVKLDADTGAEGVLEYWAGNPSVEITHGHIRLATAGAGDCASGGGCVLLSTSVPCYMSPAEFCDFMGAFAMETHRQFRHCRVLHGPNPEEYLVAMWLDSPESVQGLIDKFHGKPYNSIEAAVCRLQRISLCSRVLLTAESHEQDRSRRDASLPGQSPNAASPSRPLGSPALPVRPPAGSPLLSPGHIALPATVDPPPVAGAMQKQLPPSALDTAGIDAEFPVVESLFGSLLPSGRSLSLGPPGSPGSRPTSPPQRGSHHHASSASPAQLRRHDTPAAMQCTVCLESIESQPDTYQLSELGGGVPLTILCGHTFHARCLSRWCDATCPVCRFQQHPNQVSCCDICGRSDALHICLVCGFIGCIGSESAHGSLALESGVSSGEAMDAHAMQHFESTRHTYALEVSTQRVWDYAGNGYVHRLLTNSEDGKMVEHTMPEEEELELHGLDLEDKAERKKSAKGSKKEESLVNEFNALLASQMTAQRRYYENKQKEQEHEHELEVDALREKQLAAARSAATARAQLERVLESSTAIEAEIAKVAAEEEVMARQVKALEGLNEKIAEQQRAYEAQQDGAREKLRLAKEKRSQEVQELQQQVKDLERHLQMNRKCGKMGDAADLQTGVVLITENDAHGAGRGRRGRRRGGH